MDKYGPNTAQVEAYLAKLPGLDDVAWDAARGVAWGAARGVAWGAAWDAAWDVARDAAWDVARGAAWGVAWDAAWDVARDAAWDVARDAAWAAEALVVRDLISAERFDILTAPMRAAGITFDDKGE